MWTSSGMHGRLISQHMDVFLVLLVPMIVCISASTDRFRRNYVFDQQPFCPFRNAEPCDCSYPSNLPEPDYSSVVCRSVPTNQVFLAMLDKIRQVTEVPTYKDGVQYLYLYSSTVDALAPHVFVGFKVHGITIKNTQFIDQRTTVGGLFQALQGTLSQLHISNCHLTARNFIHLHLLPQLRRVVVTGNKISSLSASLISQPTENLREVYLHSNHIEKLERYIFTNARRLKILLLNDNLIENWDRSFLPNPADELRELHLRKNKLETLPSEMFLNMPRLILLDLSENNIQHLPETIWKPVWKQLTDIYLKGNPIRCNCTLHWLSLDEAEMAHSFRHGRFIYAKCASPRHLLGKSVELLTRSDTMCPA